MCVFNGTGESLVAQIFDLILHLISTLLFLSTRSLMQFASSALLVLTSSFLAYFSFWFSENVRRSRLDFTSGEDGVGETLHDMCYRATSSFSFCLCPFVAQERESDGVQPFKHFSVCVCVQKSLLCCMPASLCVCSLRDFLLSFVWSSSSSSPITQARSDAAERS